MFIENTIASLKITLLSGLTRYSQSTILDECLNPPPLWRHVIKLTDLKSNTDYFGMAEGHLKKLAQLRALAEAYERLCRDQFEKASQRTVNRAYPFGLGVGMRKRSAQLRAYGEYWERRGHSRAPLLEDGQQVIESIKTPVGTIWVCFSKGTDGILGSGYGQESAQAEDSALRSMRRKKDFPQNQVEFKVPNDTPQLIRITPVRDAWLECYLVGHLI